MAERRRGHAAALAAAGLALAAAPAAADELTYENRRFGTTFRMPAHMFDQIAPPPSNGDGITLTNADGAMLAIFARNDLGGGSARALRARLEADREAAGYSVTYRASGEGWVVLSGFAGELIYYERYERGADGVIHGALIQYPPETEQRYEPLVESFDVRLSDG